jgi:nitrogen regulatory protein PII
MMRIEALIQPHRVSRVVLALHALPRFPGFTVFDAHGQGPGRGKDGHYDYAEESVLYHRHSVLVVICEDEEVEMLTKLITHAAHTGKRGDGIVAVSAVSRVLNIRDAGGENGGVT